MAIAFDAATDGGNNGGTTNSRTFAHVCTGSDRLLLVGFKGDVVAGNDDITSVTYGGVAMTFIAKRTSGIDRFTYLYYLLNPASGSNNVVVSCTNNHYLIPCAASYTGVAQSGQPDASVTNTGAGSVTGTVTTTADNCWLMGVGVQNFSGVQMAAGAGTTERVEEAAFLTVGMYDSNSATTPAGSDSLVVTNIGGTMAIIVASFAPAGGGGGDVTLTADPGSYAITGTVASLEQGYVLGADTGSFSISGVAANLTQGYEVAAVPGEYLVSGVDANFLLGFGFSADAGSYSITGTTTTLLVANLLNAEVWSYLLTGVAANLNQGLEIAVDPGSYSLTGTNANFVEGFGLSADVGSYLITGVSANLLQHSVLNAAVGSYVITGVAANLAENLENIVGGRFVAGQVYYPGFVNAEIFYPGFKQAQVNN